MRVRASVDAFQCLIKMTVKMNMGQNSDVLSFPGKFPCKDRQCQGKSKPFRSISH